MACTGKTLTLFYDLVLKVKATSTSDTYKDKVINVKVKVRRTDETSYRFE
jgi:hypothetical protein